MKTIWWLLLVACSFSVEAGQSPAVPSTLEEAFSALDALFTPADRDAFMHKTERRAVVDAHMSAGLYIRNVLFRTGGSPLVGMLREKGARALDDASSMVLVSYWRHLNGKPIELEQQGACYERWWAEQHRLESEAKANGSESYQTPSFGCP